MANSWSPPTRAKFLLNFSKLKIRTEMRATRRPRSISQRASSSRVLKRSIWSRRSKGKHVSSFSSPQPTRNATEQHHQLLACAILCFCLCHNLILKMATSVHSMSSMSISTHTFLYAYVSIVSYMLSRIPSIFDATQRVEVLPCCFIIVRFFARLSNSPSLPNLGTHSPSI